MRNQINTCPHFWDDVKYLRKKFKLRELKATFEIEADASSDYEMITSIPLIKAIVTYIKNVCDEHIEQCDCLSRQPFLQNGLTLYKIRYAFNGKSKNEGLRVIFATTDDILLLIYINTKNECADEKALESEVNKRLKYYLNL